MTRVINIKKLHLCICIFIITTFTAGNTLGFEYESDKRAKEEQKEIDELKSREGKRYWILPNTYIKFYIEQGILSDNFSVTDTTSFIVKEWIPDKSVVSKYTSHYKVIFESGKVAYISATTLNENNYSYEKYIRTEDPKVEEISKEVEELLRKEEEQEQRIADQRKRLKQEMKPKVQALIRAKIGKKLPPKYKGNDFQEIYLKLFAPLLGKKEFEKTEDYKKRLQAINLNEIYAFRVSDNENLHIKYDADNELFKIKLMKLRSRRMMPKPYDFAWVPFIILHSTNEKTSSYMGSNAFGAKVQITKYEATKYGVYAVNNIQLNYNLFFTMPIKDAKKYNDSLAILLICKPVIKNDILAFMGTYYNEPTFDSPIETVYATLGISVELLEIWIYDFITGRILHKEYIEYE